MLESARSPENRWRNVAARLDELEALSRTEVGPHAFYDEAFQALSLSFEPDSLRLTLHRRGNVQVIAPAMADPGPNREHGDDGDALESANTRAIVATRRLGKTSTLQLRGTGKYSVGTDSAAYQAYLEAVLDLCTIVFLTQQNEKLNSDPVGSCDRDLIHAVSEHGDPDDRLHAICLVINAHLGADRVTLLRCHQGSARCMASSAQRNFERRSRSVRQLESIAETIVAQQTTIDLLVGDPSTYQRPIRDDLLDYLDESGVKQLMIDTLPPASPVPGSPKTSMRGPRFVIAIERFRVPEAIGHESIFTTYQPYQDSISAAVRSCQQSARHTHRIQAYWNSLAVPTQRVIKRATFALVGIVLLFPMRIDVVADGTMQAFRHQRFYAPASGTVVDIPVENDQVLRKGSIVAMLRSPEIELQLESVRGDLTTTQAEIASLLADRTDSQRTNGRQLDLSRSTNEHVLRTRAKSLRRQLDLLTKVQRSLELRTAIDGQVVRWDQHQSLVGRNVAQGQLLVEVLDRRDGLFAELLVPDREYHRLMQEDGTNAPLPRNCTLRLPAQPGTQLAGTVTKVSNTVELGPDAQSLLRVQVQVQGNTEAIPLGASVEGTLHCGRSPLILRTVKWLQHWVGRLLW